MTKRPILTIKGSIPAAGTPSAPGGHDPPGTTITKASAPTGKPAVGVTAERKARAAFFVDGFNLYHAINDLGQPHLKWLDLWKLCTLLIDHSKEELVLVRWCTASNPDFPAKVARFSAYKKALISTGVAISEGHFVHSPLHCPTCGPYSKPTEKAGDVNVAIHAVAEALTGGADVVYLVTADTDQAATCKFLREICPEVGIVIVAPVGRIHSQHLLEYATGDRTITEDALIEAMFAKNVTARGKHVVDRPRSYDPPAGWNKDKALRKANPTVPSKVEVVIKKSRKPKLPKT